MYGQGVGGLADTASCIFPPPKCSGYQSLGANVTRYDGGFQRDWHEAIDLYKELNPAEVAVSMAVRPRVQGRMGLGTFQVAWVPITAVWRRQRVEVKSFSVWGEAHIR